MATGLTVAQLMPSVPAVVACIACAAAGCRFGSRSTPTLLAEPNVTVVVSCCGECRGEPQVVVTGAREAYPREEVGVTSSGLFCG